MATADRNLDFITETVLVTPAVEAVYKTVTTEVATIDLSLSQDEADSLATLLHCHVGGLQRSPSLQAILRALKDCDSNTKASALIQQDTTGNEGKGWGCLVLFDLFKTDSKGGVGSTYKG